MNTSIKCAIVAAGLILATGCNVPKVVQREVRTDLPSQWAGSADTTNAARLSWRAFFSDPWLQGLIDTAISNNQELNSTLQEIEIARNEVRIRKGAILPVVSARAGVEAEKPGRYTAQGAGDAATEILPGKETPDPLTNYNVGLVAAWEADIWKKLRNARDAAVNRYLATAEGKNFVLTSLIAEVAEAYYELLGLDDQLTIVRQNITLQESALEVIRVQKGAARATELAVQKFQAEVFKTKSLEAGILQEIRETENRINSLLARYPQTVARAGGGLQNLIPPAVQAGVPSQLLSLRPDIRQAELELRAAKLDVSVARKEFYPSLGISAGIGLAAFRPGYLARLPESILFSIAGDMAAPLLNRNRIKAEYFIANAKQRQAVLSYEQKLIRACTEISNDVSGIANLQQSTGLKTEQVAALIRSVDISSDLFRAARADYLEVLMTQRDALEARLELVENKKALWASVISLYRHFGGGWQ